MGPVADSFVVMLAATATASLVRLALHLWRMQLYLKQRCVVQRMHGCHVRNVPTMCSSCTSFGAPSNESVLSSCYSYAGAAAGCTCRMPPCAGHAGGEVTAAAVSYTQ
ncbi:hypothetical protein COO60DRAFT_1492458 [Scenedesmus sp. NREL 46B-D3]|nr:hypothetical protein COO60DRAFT_1492458 [Scenedesmus sp. NREL 46B-D3]